MHKLSLVYMYITLIRNTRLANDGTYAKQQLKQTLFDTGTRADIHIPG